MLRRHLSGRPSEYSVHADPTPALRGIEPASAIEHGDHLIARGELGERQRELVSNEPAHEQAVGIGLDRPRVIRYPRGCGERIAQRTIPIRRIP